MAESPKYNMRSDWGQKERRNVMIPIEMVDACEQVQGRRAADGRAPSFSSIVVELLERGLLELGREYTEKGDPLCTSSGKLVL